MNSADDVERLTAAFARLSDTAAIYGLGTAMKDLSDSGRLQTTDRRLARRYARIAGLRFYSTRSHPRVYQFRIA